MRIYEGAPRQNYQEVLRSIGALLDQHGMREVLLTEINDGFIVQGLTPVAGDSMWGESGARLQKQTLTFVEDDIARFMDEAIARRNRQEQPVVPLSGGFYEKALRVLGAYVDEQKPRDMFFLEQDHAFVMRLLMAVKGGVQHVLVEFTAEDIEAMVSAGQTMRAQRAEP
jgi:hypothetical protein